MRYKVAVCDDMEDSVTYITNAVKKWADVTDNTVEISSFPSSEAFLFNYEDENDFDILLLDIEMKGMNGVDLAKKLRSENNESQIVFITGYSEFIGEGYDVSALHYLLKPVDEEKLLSVLDRAVKVISKRESRISVTFDRQTEFISLSKILYLEAQKQYTVLYTVDETLKVKKSLSEFELQLDEKFLRCQRSFIVNLSYVSRIKNDYVVLKNGTEIPISRGMSEKIGKEIIRLF